MKFCLPLFLIAVSPALGTTEFTNWYAVAIGVLQVNFLVSTTTFIGPQPIALNLNVTGVDGTESHVVTLWVAN
jgi:hypothetical protein